MKNAIELIADDQTSAQNRNQIEWRSYSQLLR